MTLFDSAAGNPSRRPWVPRMAAVGAGWEVRNPKAEGRKKPEIRNPKPEAGGVRS